MPVTHRIRAGKLRTKFVIEQHDGSTTKRGKKDGGDDKWKTIAEAWGNLMPLGGFELERARKLMANVTSQLTLRYRADFDFKPKHRLRVKGTTRIVHLSNMRNVDNRNQKWLGLAAEEII